MPDFSIVGSTVAEVELTQVGGFPGLGRYHVSLVARIKPRYLEEQQILVLEDLSGELRVAAQGQAARHAGPLTPPGGTPCDLSFHGGKNMRDQDCQMACALDQRQMQMLEDLRLGGALVISATIRARARLVAAVDKVVVKEGVVWTDATLGIPQGTWVEVLRQMAFQDCLLLEVPRPDVNGPTALAEALRYLVAAQTAMSRGEYRESVGACRDVLEALSASVGDESTNDADSQVLFANTRSMDKAGRYRTARRALKLLTHPARHADEVAGQFEWNRGDAVAILSAVTAMLNQSRGA